MARTAGTSARAHRLIGLAAALLLAAATALAFGRVFLGGRTTLQLLGTAAAAAGLAVLFERRSLLLSTVVSAAGLAFAVGLIVFPHTTWYGLPTGDTLRAAIDAAAQVGAQARIQVAPAEPIDPLLLAAVVSLWSAVFSAHALAFRAGSPLLGLIPPVALVAFADTVLEEVVKPLYGVLFLAAALLVAFADALARVQGWGPMWSSARRGVAATAARGARPVALTALAIATFAPLLVPGFGSKAVLDFGTPAEDRVSIDPYVSVRNQLSRSTPVEVLRMTSPRPTYIRLVSLPDFNGAGWLPADGPPGTTVAPGQRVPAVQASLTPPTTVAFDVTHDLDMPWLPSPYPVWSIDSPGSSVRYEPESGTAFVDDRLQKGDSYTVQAAFLDATDEELRSIEFPDPDPGDRYLALPDDTPTELSDIATDWTAGRTNVFDEVMAIQEHLRDTRVFHYDENTNARSGTQSILQFLTITRTGFCQQFADSMAVLLRSIGIPSRVVIGFTNGTRDPVTDEYVITTDRAHSWVEVRFPGLGWMPFDPTPGRLNPVTAGYTRSSGDVCEGPDCPPDPVRPTDGPVFAQPDRFERGMGAQSPRGAVGEPGTIDSRGEDPGISTKTLLVAGAILLAALLLLVPPSRALRRRVRLRRAAAEPRRLILVTYDLFAERAGSMGLGRDRAETMQEYRRKVMLTGHLSNGHLDRLTSLATAAAYSSREPDDRQARDATEAAQTALREISRAVGPARWLLGLYRRGPSF
jgi:transglutaminase-like putative cysteine protease